MVEVGKNLEGKLLTETANTKKNKPPHFQIDTITSEDTVCYSV